MVLKPVLNSLNKVKTLVEPLGRFIPECIKNEYKLMGRGVKTLRAKLDKSYTMGRLSAELLGNSRVTSVARGIGSAVTSTKITKNDIPSLFALTGLATPIPLGMETGYTIGRLISSKPAVKAAHFGKRTLHSTYSAMNNLFRI